jgi:hypothetical protein
MATKDRLKKALDSINEVLREVQRLQPSVVVPIISLTLTFNLSGKSTSPVKWALAG